MEWGWVLLLVVIVLWCFDRHVTKQYWTKVVLDATTDTRGLLDPHASALAAPLAPLPQEPTRENPEVVSRALWRIAEYVLADFVEYWYLPSVSDDPDFPNDVRAMLDTMINELSNRVVRVDWRMFVVERVLRHLIRTLRQYRLTEDLLLASKPGFAEAEEQDRALILQSELLRNFRVHYGVEQPELYLRKLSSLMISRLTSPADQQCAAFRSLLREILTNNLLLPSMFYATPYYINTGIVAALGHPEAVAGAIEGALAHPEGGVSPASVNSKASPTSSASSSDSPEAPDAPRMDTLGDFLRPALHDFYLIHNPEKCSRVESLLRSYANNERRMIRDLTLKYGQQSTLALVHEYEEWHQQADRLKQKAEKLEAARRVVRSPSSAEPDSETVGKEQEEKESSSEDSGDIRVSSAGKERAPKTAEPTDSGKNDPEPASKAPEAKGSDKGEEEDEEEGADAKSPEEPEHDEEDSAPGLDQVRRKWRRLRETAEIQAKIFSREIPNPGHPVRRETQLVRKLNAWRSEKNRRRNQQQLRLSAFIQQQQQQQQQQHQQQQNAAPAQQQFLVPPGSVLVQPMASGPDALGRRPMPDLSLGAPAQALPAHLLPLPPAPVLLTQASGQSSNPGAPASNPAQPPPLSLAASTPHLLSMPSPRISPGGAEPAPFSPPEPGSPMLKGAPSQLSGGAAPGSQAPAQLYPPPRPFAAAPQASSSFPRGGPEDPEDRPALAADAGPLPGFGAESERRQPSISDRRYSSIFDVRPDSGFPGEDPAARFSGRDAEAARPARGSASQVNSGRGPASSAQQRTSRPASAVGGSGPLPSGWDLKLDAGVDEARTFFDPKPFISYRVRVAISVGPSASGRVSWAVQKRFQEFEKLHQRLRRSVPVFDAQLPPKQLFGRFRPDFVILRKQQLHTYLQQLCRNRYVCESPDLCGFLLPEPQDPAFAIASRLLAPSLAVNAELDPAARKVQKDSMLKTILTLGYPWGLGGAAAEQPAQPAGPRKAAPHRFSVFEAPSKPGEPPGPLPRGEPDQGGGQDFQEPDLEALSPPASRPRLESVEIRLSDVVADDVLDLPRSPLERGSALERCAEEEDPPPEPEAPLSAAGRSSSPPEASAAQEPLGSSLAANPAEESSSRRGPSGGEAEGAETATSAEEKAALRLAAQEKRMRRLNDLAATFSSGPGAEPSSPSHRGKGPALVRSHTMQPEPRGPARRTRNSNSPLSPPANGNSMNNNPGRQLPRLSRNHSSLLSSQQQQQQQQQQQSPRPQNSPLTSPQFSQQSPLQHHHAVPQSPISLSEEQPAAEADDPALPTNGSAALPQPSGPALPASGSAASGPAVPPVAGAASASAALGVEVPESISKDLIAAVTGPIHELIQEVFGLMQQGFVRRQTHRLARQLLKLAFHGSIFKWYDDQLSFLTGEQHVLSLLGWLAESVWPGGVFYSQVPGAGDAPPEPSPAMEEQARTEARRLVLESMPASLTRLLGKQACQDAAIKLFYFMQSEQLMQHLAFSILDDLVVALFPELESASKNARRTNV